MQKQCLSTAAARAKLQQEAVDKPKTAVLMLNMGGPDTTDKVEQYLHRIMTDRNMIQLPMQR